MSTTKAPVKGNKTTEIVLGSAAMKLSSAVTAVLAAVEVVKGLDEKAQDSTLLVTNLEDKIGGLEQDYKNKVAQSKIELQQAYESDKESFVDLYLKQKNLQTINSTELEELNNKVTKFDQILADTVSKEVGKAVGIEKSNSASALKVATLEFTAKEAQNTAEITQLKNQVTFMTEQVTMWKTALEDERKAGVERAKAGSIGTLNVGATQQGR